MLIQFITGWSMIGPTIVFLLPRLVMLVLSFAVDWCVYQVSMMENFFLLPLTFWEDEQAFISVTHFQQLCLMFATKAGAFYRGPLLVQ
jgi:hypothetical protein